MDTGAPALEVGFQIDTGGSADDLIRLGGTMDAVEARVLADAKRIEAATGSMIDLRGATASISTFGNAASRDLKDAAREIQRVEQSGERLVRQLEKQTNEFGKTRAELRAMKVGQAEYERSSTTLAGRLDEVQRAQARAAAGLDDAIDDRRLSASELANVVAQLSDIGVSLAGGQNPFLVLIQQGSQLQGLAMQSGLGVAGLAKAIVGLAFVTTPAAAAAEALTAAEAAQTAALSGASVAGQRAALSAAELAVAQEAATTAGTRHAATEAAVALARTEAAAAGGLDAAANGRLAAAELAAAAAATELAAAQGAATAATLGSANAATLR